MSYSDNKRRRAIAAYAEPAPQSPNGIYVNLRIGLYDTDGHSALSPINNRDKHAVLHCRNDLELVAEFAKLIAVQRRRQGRR